MLSFCLVWLMGIAVGIGFCILCALVWGRL